MGRNLPQANWSPEIFELFEGLDFLNMDIAGLGMSVFSCVWQNAGTLEAKLVLAIILPFILSGAIAWVAHRKLTWIEAIHNEGSRSEDDLKELSAQGGKGVDSRSVILCRAMVDILTTAKGLSPINPKKVLSGVERDMTQRLFSSYDADGSGAIEEAEVQLFITHLGLNLSREEMFRLVTASMSGNCDVVALSVAELLTLVAAYKMAISANLSEEEENDLNFTVDLYPVGSSAWHHDEYMRTQGKKWKNVILTQYLFVPPVVMLCVSTFVCDPQTITGQPDTRLGVQFLRADSSVICDSEGDAWLKSIAGLGIFAYAFCIPAFWLFSLYENRNRLNSFETQQRLGFLYVCYKDRSESKWAYLWDVFETIRKIVLGSLIVFVDPGSMSQLGVFFIACLFFHYIHLSVKPFTAAFDNRLQANALTVNVLTIFYVVWLAGVQGDSEKTNVTVSTWLVLVLNAILVFTILASMFVLYSKTRTPVESKDARHKADAALIANSRATAKITMDTASPAEGFVVASKAMDAINSHNEMKATMLEAKSMDMEFSSSEDDDEESDGDEESGSPTHLDDTPRRAKAGQPIS
jgi:hypothetical protein